MLMDFAGGFFLCMRVVFVILTFSGTGTTGHVWHCSIMLFVILTDVLTFQRKGRTIFGLIISLIT